MHSSNSSFIMLPIEAQFERFERFERPGKNPRDLSNAPFSFTPPVGALQAVDQVVERVLKVPQETVIEVAVDRIVERVVTVPQTITIEVPVEVLVERVVRSPRRGPLVTG